MVLLLALSGLFPVRGAAFDAIYGFGDSLTDTGNNPAPAVGYYQGRYSNGPLWIEYLSTQLNLVYNPANNFAQSGGETSDALNQVQRFAAPTNVSTALFVVWAGGNDFIDNFNHAFDDTFWAGEITTAVANLSNAVQVLYGKGARTIVVPNLPDLGRLPALNSLPFPPQFISVARTYLRGKVSEFNAALASALAAMGQARPDLQLFVPDVFQRFDTLLAALSAYGFTNASNDALDDPQLTDKSFNGPGASYVFWDPIHPTTKAHGLIAQWIYSLLPATPSPQLSLTAVGGGWRLTLGQLVTGRVYTLQTSTNLTAWSDAAAITATNSTQQTTVGMNAAAAGFFRLKL